MTDAIWAGDAVAGSLVRDRSGRRWTVIGRVLVDDDDPSRGSLLAVTDADGRIRFFPLCTIFTTER